VTFLGKRVAISCFFLQKFLARCSIAVCGSHGMTLIVTERDNLNQERELWLSPENVTHLSIFHCYSIKRFLLKDLRIFTKNHRPGQTKRQDLKELLSKVFLPVGFPRTVTPGEESCILYVTLIYSIITRLSPVWCPSKQSVRQMTEILKFKISDPQCCLGLL